MLLEGYSYSLISSLAGLHKTTVSDIARLSGCASEISKKHNKFKKSKKTVTFKIQTDMPKQKAGFAMWVRKNGRIALPHDRQCKNILSLHKHDYNKDFYCQNERPEGQSYCASCHAINHTITKVKG